MRLFSVEHLSGHRAADAIALISRGSSEADKADKWRTCPQMSAGHSGRTKRTHPYKGCPLRPDPEFQNPSNSPWSIQQGLDGAPPARVMRRAGRRLLRLAPRPRSARLLTIDQRISRGIFGGFPPNNSPPLPRADFLGS